MKDTPTKIKKEMGKNTTLFIDGKRSKKDYMKKDDELHDRLFKVLKKRKK